jgi:hypothetical protein
MMLRRATLYLIFLTALCVNAAPLAITAPTTSRPPHLKPINGHFNTTRDHDDDTKPPGLRDPRFPSHQTRHTSSSWVYLIAKILAGLAILCAIFVIVFWLYRRRERGRRRRIGEMMGLGIKRNGILLEERKRNGKKGRRKYSHKDHGAHKWRKQDEKKGGDGTGDGKGKGKGKEEARREEAVREGERVEMRGFVVRARTL